MAHVAGPVPSNALSSAGFVFKDMCPKACSDSHDCVDASPLLENGDQYGDGQLWPVAPLEDGGVWVLDGLGDVDSLHDVFKLDVHICNRSTLYPRQCTRTNANQPIDLDLKI